MAGSVYDGGTGTYTLVTTNDTALDLSSMMGSSEFRNIQIIDKDESYSCGATVSFTGGPTFAFDNIGVSGSESLTLNAANVIALNKAHQLIIKGDADDSVNLLGFHDAGANVVINGETFDKYVAGTGAHPPTVLVDQDIAVTV